MPHLLRSLLGSVQSFSHSVIQSVSQSVTPGICVRLGGWAGGVCGITPPHSSEKRACVLIHNLRAYEAVKL